MNKETNEFVDNFVKKLTDNPDPKSVVMQLIKDVVTICHIQIERLESSEEHEDGGIPVADLFENEHHGTLYHKIN